MLDGENIGKHMIKIIRVLWGEGVNKEVPRIPLYPNQEVVYAFDYESFWFSQNLGYETHLVKNDIFEGPDLNNFGRKLQALDLALKEYGEVILLDWDCYILKHLDKEFYNSLKEKPIQIPLYIQHIDTAQAIIEIQEIPPSKSFVNEMKTMEEGFHKYGWKWEEGIVAPNFGFVYCRDTMFGADLLKLAIDNDLKTVVDEFATLLYADCSLEEFIEKYVPRVLKGRSDQMLIFDNRLHDISRKFTKWLDTKINITEYFEHV